MFERPQTIRQVAELRVERRLDAINLDIIARLMKYEPNKWCEATVPAVGDMVFVHKMELLGEVIEHDKKSGYYRIQFVSSAKIYARTGDFIVKYDERPPAWQTMWSFSDGFDDR